MKKEKLLVIGIVGLLILNLGTLGFLFLGQRNSFPMGRPKGPPPVDKIIIEGLKLDETQIDKFEQLKKEHRHGMEDFELQNKVLHDAYFEKLKSDSINKNDLQVLLTKISYLAVYRDSITFDHFRKIRFICNANQKASFDKLIDDIIHTMHARNEGRRPGKNGPNR